MSSRPKSIWRIVKENWNHFALAVVLLVGFGAAKVRVESIEDDVTGLKQLELPVVRSRVETITKIADDVTAIKVEQARQAADLHYIRQQVEQRVK